MAYDIEVGDGLVCDDVRREDNGKLILIGVYSSNMIVRELPAVLAPYLVIKLKANEPVDRAIQFRIMLNGEKIRSGKGRIKLSPGPAHWIVVPAIILDKLATEGVLDFDLQIEDSEWKTVCSLQLVLARPIDATAPQQPS
jgi:hypothetical protein